MLKIAIIFLDSDKLIREDEAGNFVVVLAALKQKTGNKQMKQPKMQVLVRQKPKLALAVAKTYRCAWVKLKRLNTTETKAFR